jgi:hypothetical protein
MRARSPLLILALALGTSAMAASDRNASAAAPSLHEMRFIDEDTSQAISVQLDQAALDLGHWTLAVTGRTYSGDARTAVKLNSPTSVVINYDGLAVRRSGTAAAMVQVRLNAQLDPAHHTAEVTLWDTSDRFHFVAKAPTVAGLDKTLSAVEGAIVANDPVALYPFLNQQITRTYDQSVLTSLWNAESAVLGRVTALRRTSVGAPRATDQGFWVTIAEYSADIQTPSGPGSAAFSAILIHEPSGWKLWSTERH